MSAIRVGLRAVAVGALAMLVLGACGSPSVNGDDDGKRVAHQDRPLVQLGPRPYWLVAGLADSTLKSKLLACTDKRPRRARFSIAHRGAPLQFPEHTRESYEAAVRMGAGIVECDVSFTKDRKLVCRHSQCDLHRSTNILATPLANKCSEPFRPAADDRPAGARCCTSDITLAEFKTLRGKMDAVDRNATTIKGYLGGTARYRTDLYASSGTLMSHAESIELFKALGVRMTPELKAPSVSMPFAGSYSQQDFAHQLVDEYRDAGVSPVDVYLQSFSLADIAYWQEHAPEFARQAIYLDGRYRNVPPIDPGEPASFSPTMHELADSGVRIVAPPMAMLLTLDEQGRIVPSAYARAARKAGLGIITWTLERSGFLAGGGGFYYSSIAAAIRNDSDMLRVLDVLAQDVGVMAVFSDWPATTTFYANCLGIE